MDPLANDKFPDMNALTDYVHSKGLKIGLYSSPGPKTCAGHEGSYQHEEQDARRYAEWGFDYLKYDWCSYGEIAPTVPTTPPMKPYQVMRAALTRRLATSSSAFANTAWATSGNGARRSAATAGAPPATSPTRGAACPASASARPDTRNLPARATGTTRTCSSWAMSVGAPSVRPTRLTPNEQYTHISLWCLLCSPLLIGCDLTKLDEFTLNLLTNDEVLDVSQDPLGRQAGRVARDGPLEVWAKDMEDGSKAVGLFNRGGEEAPVTANWADLHLAGTHKIRDLWRQQDLGSFTGQFQAAVPRHGVVLVKIAAQ